MQYFLTHIQDLLTGGLTLSGAEWLIFLPLLLGATIVVNFVSDTTDPMQIAGNFLSMLVGAVLGGALFPDLTPAIDLNANFSLALFSGMTLAAVINLALFRRG